MFFLFLLLVFLATAAALWFQGTWNIAITLINLILAMLIATNFFEPICTFIESLGGASFTYLLDFIVLWILFAVVFGILRLFSDMLSKKAVKFNLPVDMAGRTILSIWCAYLMVCFTAFSMQFAPLNNVTPMGAFETPNSSSFLGMAPDRQWLGFMQSRSRGALARGNYSGKIHANDQGQNVETFDPYSEIPLRYRQRREAYSQADGLRVQ
jgi:hypothetical protein